MLKLAPFLPGAKNVFSHEGHEGKKEGKTGTDGKYRTKAKYNVRTTYKKFLGIQNPFFKKGSATPTSCTAVPPRHVGDIASKLCFFRKLSGGINKKGFGRRGHTTLTLEYYRPAEQIKTIINRQQRSYEETAKQTVQHMSSSETAGSHQTAAGGHGISRQQQSNIDISMITDRVYRMLEDRLRTEKEMRGW
jgi:hypothetical protein